VAAGGAAIAWLLGACYTLGPPTLMASRGPTPVRVVLIDRQGGDVDAAAEAARALRAEIARSPDLALADDAREASVLEAELVDASAALGAQTDTRRRAGEYVARVELTVRLVDRDGGVRARITQVVGEAPFLSVPGPLVALDGQRRRALAAAADDAARRALDALRAALSPRDRAS
jgi:hypothetical protein